MNPIVQIIVNEAVKRKLKRKERANKKKYNQEFKNISIEFKDILKYIVFMTLGVFAAGFGLKGFLLPNSFIDGGVTGVSLIVNEVSEIPVSILLIILNVPFLIMAYSTIGRQFAVKSIISIFLLAAVVHFVPFPLITEDKLLISVFGGFFLGSGIGLSMRGGAVIDGTEVLAVYISRKTTLTIGDVILIFNVLIFGVAIYVFSIETSLYAMLTYLAASKTVDFVVSGIEEYVGVNIISDYSEEIRQTIIKNLGRGCTIFLGKKGYATKEEPLKETNIVYTAITRLEVSRLQKEIDKIDQNAFIVMHSIKDVKGGMIKKRPLE